MFALAMRLLRNWLVIARRYVGEEERERECEGEDSSNKGIRFVD